MIEKCYYLRSASINPYYNLALEDHLFHHLPNNSMIIMLSRFQNTVTVGSRQNVYKECRLDNMEIDHCYLARRSSGSGAVFHDLGNLNFSFIMYMDSFDIQKQTQCIAYALRKLGIPAYISGRNDIEVDGCKVSGSAYLTEREHCLHHGTVMVNVNKKLMERYLSVSDRKIKAHGVDSVRSRTANLIDYLPDVTMEKLEKAILQTVSNNYGPLYEMSVPSGFDDVIEKYHSYKYIYNTIGEYTVIVNDYCSFGEVQMYVDIRDNTISKLDIFTDALSQQTEELLRKVFEGLHVDDVSFRNRLSTVDRGQQQDLIRLYLQIRKYIFN